LFLFLLCTFLYLSHSFHFFESVVSCCLSFFSTAVVNNNKEKDAN
jgi:multisubunit Na+/H+ antiporter MnhE subunit